MKTVLVTGCAGFIGWKVSEKLIDKDLNVVGIDNINDCYDPKLKEWRLKNLQSKSQDPKYKGETAFSFYQSDIGSFEAVREVFLNHKIDAVINLAAQASRRCYRNMGSYRKGQGKTGLVPEGPD